MSNHYNIQKLIEQNNQFLKRIDSLEKELNSLKQENIPLKLENSKLKEKNAILKTENIELNRRLKLDSENSSKPPSQDPVARKGELQVLEVKAINLKVGKKDMKGII